MKRGRVEALHSLEDFVHHLPKCELHLHIEGTLEPEMLFALADRNKVLLPYKSIEEARRAYNFDDLGSFLELYYVGTSVLLQSVDFYDLAIAYFEKASKSCVHHVEFFFDVQTFTARGIHWDVFMCGLQDAMKEAEQRFDISSKLIICFRKDLGPCQAMEALEASVPYRGIVAGIGLDSNEVGNPLHEYASVYAKAKMLGYAAVAHAGEEGDPSYVWDALNHLNVSRVDHGIRSIEDAALVAELKRREITLTCCPFSNVSLKAVSSLEVHPLKKMLALGLRVTVNSDDPAYFGGYIDANFKGVVKHLDLSAEEVATLCKHAFLGSFLSPEQKQKHLIAIEEHLHHFLNPPSQKHAKTAKLCAAEEEKSYVHATTTDSVPEQKDVVAVFA
mmetsp:Transcript_23737/g.39040  ORF Transcript_23737/g.39040 Transcript_23737/m.39040 type:complete len:389 (-) Transcript_23737:352-1518(-)|eukprot:CAMPEP_0184650070 /NCGR_PEP_ID=MMETSP0308-20130426/7560_1 /TAXON_ID=38269 /ORGANISM="Gloeochaete witrockiana, Strain SAG 46.84" /LENGTH=388 /DNA_ID=CAMNT_0027083315 /DNA_START=70 /DNA_END=1236 /DNA_ORIENTATION=-